MKTINEFTDKVVEAMTKKQKFFIEIAENDALNAICGKPENKLELEQRVKNCVLQSKVWEQAIVLIRTIEGEFVKQ